MNYTQDKATNKNNYEGGDFKSDILLAKRMFKRFEIYYCCLEQDCGNKDSCLIGKPDRPCLVISPDDFNNHSKKVVVLPFCSNNGDMSEEDYLKRQETWGEKIIPVVLNRREPSYLICNQPRLIYQSKVDHYIGRLSKEDNPALYKQLMEMMSYMFIDPDYHDNSFDIRKMTKEEIITYLETREELRDIITNKQAKRKRGVLNLKDFSEAYELYKKGEITPTEMTEILGVSYSTVMRRIKEFENKELKMPL